MARLIRAQKILALKIVYYGPGLSGKTANLERLHRNYPDDKRGALVKLDTENERTLFFDYFPAEIGTMSGFALKADLFTVPGQSFYHATRRVVLDGADGIVFVADSDPRREEANLESLRSLGENLESYGRSLADVPLVFQWNKRDLPKTLPVKLLERTLNPGGRPSFEASAVNGVGVVETQEAVLAGVMEDLRARSNARKSS